MKKKLDKKENVKTKLENTSNVQSLHNEGSLNKKNNKEKNIDSEDYKIDLEEVEDEFAEAYHVEFDEEDNLEGYAGLEGDHQYYDEDDQYHGDFEEEDNLEGCIGLDGDNTRDNHTYFDEDDDEEFEEEDYVDFEEEDNLEGLIGLEGENHSYYDEDDDEEFEEEDNLEGYVGLESHTTIENHIYSEEDNLEGYEGDFEDDYDEYFDEDSIYYDEEADIEENEFLDTDDTDANTGEQSVEDSQEEDREIKKEEATKKIESSNRFGKEISTVSSIRSVNVKKIMLATASISALVIGIIIASYWFANSNIEKHETAMAIVGQQLSEITTTGGSGLEEIVNIYFKEINSESVEVAEGEVVEKVEVIASFISHSKDLKIKFINNETKEPIAEVPFEVALVDSNDKEIVLIDDNRDGIIYEESLKPGEYQAIIKNIDDFKFPQESQSIKVKEKLEYQKIDIMDEVKSESEINAEIEDIKNEIPLPEPTIIDTVEFVETTAIPNVDVPGAYIFTGWQTLNGLLCYFDKNGTRITGTQIIQGVSYQLGEEEIPPDPAAVPPVPEVVPPVPEVVPPVPEVVPPVVESGLMIDVSKHQGAINWEAVKNAGVSSVIIRCGYRGTTSGALIEDQYFRTNIEGATAAGLKVGVYMYSQALNEVEAIEEASMALSLVSGYNLTYPIFIDVESSGGRGDTISVEARTANIKAFGQTVTNSGYKAGVYSNKKWFENQINTTELTDYVIWLAHYAAATDYNKTQHHIWQYSESGRVDGINTGVDMNVNYLPY